MKTHLLIAALVAVAALPAASASDVTVTLIVRTTAADAPPIHDCQVTVPAGSDLAAVLDQAEADGCILGWTCVDYGFDCFVDSVDGIAGGPMFSTYWAFWFDGAYGESGVRGTPAMHGSVYELEYEQGLVWPSPI